MVRPPKECGEISLKASSILSLSIDAQTEAAGVYFIEELDEHRHAYLKMVGMKNGKPMQLSATDHLCHNAHSQCVNAVSSTDLVCAHHARYGLVNFPSLCEIRFQNCLIKSRESKRGKKNKHGKFEFNGQFKGCEYYVEKTKTVPDAIKQYHLEHKDHNLNTYITEKNKKKKH